LLGDHITAIRVITADGNLRWIERGQGDSGEKDLFYAVLGGSPGNYAILTHIRLQALKSDAHPHARGVRLVTPYTTRAMRSLLQVRTGATSLVHGADVI
jgi:FAD/FMN-containing dehydrogenase